MLTLSNDTLARLDSIQIDRDIRGIADWLYQRFEPWFQGIGADPHDVARSVRRIQQWAQTKALRRNKDIRMLAVISVTQGTFFYSDPRFAAVFNRAARQFELDPDARLDGIFAAFDGWRQNVVGPDGWHGVAKRTAELLSDDSAMETARPAGIADHVLPAQAGWAGQAEHEQFLNAVVAQGQHHHLPTRRHHASHMALSVLLGYRWLDDPKLNSLAKLILQERDPDAMTRGIALRLTEHKS